MANSEHLEARLRVHRELLVELMGHIIPPDKAGGLPELHAQLFARTLWMPLDDNARDAAEDELRQIIERVQEHLSAKRQRAGS